jgi:putative chitinase
MLEANLNTSQRIASFLAQVFAECGMLTTFEENGNYTAQRLIQVFPKYFTLEQANDYQHNPKRIFNRVYANRMGNGDESSGDGYNYSGKGPLQLTGKDNYKRCGTYLNVDLVSFPEKLLDPMTGMRSAGWFWTAHKMNAVADTGDFDKLTCAYKFALEPFRSLIVNGGMNGAEVRRALYVKILGVL